MTDTLVWLRRDLRLADHPALDAAARAAGGGRVLLLFVIDPRLWGTAGAPRRAWLVRSLRALHDSCAGSLVIRTGDPVDVVPQVVKEIGAGSVHVSVDAGPYGRVRDDAVEASLVDVPLVRTGSPYVVAPGTLTTAAGSPYRVFTAFYHRWLDLAGPGPGLSAPALRVGEPVPSEDLPREPALDSVTLPEAGEAAALARWEAFENDGLCRYDEHRDRPDLDGTSVLSTHLKFGEIHPRTLLRYLADHRCAGAVAFRRQLAFRDFYADVLWHRPGTARSYLQPALAQMPYDQPRKEFAAWRGGRTGYPIVDAGMRQLLSTGWMYNRVRMITASFLVKDLHIEWTHGARYFLQRLRDGDLASNQHGWQWVAGSGADAAPYFRVFNPVLQGRKFDPAGDYVRRWVPELAHLAGADVHEPGAGRMGTPTGYACRIVDHGAERAEALRRYEAVRLTGSRDGSAH